MCLRFKLLPSTVRNLHLPACISSASKGGIQLHILKRMKRGIRAIPERAKKETRELDSELKNLYNSDHEKLRRCSTQAFEASYRGQSERLRRKLVRLNGGRSEFLQPDTSESAFTADTGATRVTDKTENLSDVEKAVFSRGPKFALSTAIDETTREDCRTAFARFAYQYRWSVARGDDQDRRHKGNVPVSGRHSENFRYQN